MENPIYLDDENISKVHQDKDYDDYNTQNTSITQETTFTDPDTTETTLTLWLG